MGGEIMMKTLTAVLFSAAILWSQIIGITNTSMVATPTLDIDTGTYLGVKLVTPSCATSGADIYYTTNGTTPTSGSTHYVSGTIATTSTGMTLKLIGIKAGLTDSTVKTAVYTTSLVSGWKTTDGSGSTITDQVATSANHFTMTSGTWSGSLSPLTDSAIFNGSTTNAVVSSTSAFNYERTDSFSAIVWNKNTSASTTTAKAQQLIGRLEGSPNFRGWRLQLIYFPANGTTVINTGWQVHIALYSTYPTSTLSGYCQAVPSINAVHSIGFSYAGTSADSGLKLYLDGTACTMHYDSAGSLATILNSTALHLGGDSYTTASIMQGNLANAYIYNRVLTPTEFATLHSSPYAPGL